MYTRFVAYMWAYTEFKAEVWCLRFLLIYREITRSGKSLKYVKKGTTHQ